MAQPQIDLEALAKDVRYLKDRADISDAIHRYTRGVDRLDFELAKTAYHPDAVDDRGAFTGSPEAFMTWLKPHLSGAGGTSHNISNVTIELDGDQAHAESYVIYHVWMPDGASVVIGGARYIDRLERRKGVWAIMHREALMDFIFRGPTTPLQPNSMIGARDRSDRSYLRPLEPTPDAKQRLQSGA